jgi:hypothetical protein
VGIIACYFHVFAVDPSDFVTPLFLLKIVISCVDRSVYIRRCLLVRPCRLHLLAAVFLFLFHLLLNRGYLWSRRRLQVLSAILELALVFPKNLTASHNDRSLVSLTVSIRPVSGGERDCVWVSVSRLTLADFSTFLRHFVHVWWLHGQAVSEAGRSSEIGNVDDGWVGCWSS